MAARLLSRSAPSTKPKGDGGTSGVMFGDVTPCRVACAQVSATQLQSIAPGEGARQEGVLVYKLCYSVQRTSTAGHKSKTLGGLGTRNSPSALTWPARCLHCCVLGEVLRNWLCPMAPVQKLLCIAHM